MLISLKKHCKFLENLNLVSEHALIFNKMIEKKCLKKYWWRLWYFSCLTRVFFCLKINIFKAQPYKYLKIHCKNIFKSILCFILGPQKSLRNFSALLHIHLLSHRRFNMAKSSASFKLRTQHIVISPAHIDFFYIGPFSLLHLPFFNPFHAV